MSKSPRKRTRITAAQRDIHRRIEAESAHSLRHPRCWRPEEYPHLWQLLEAAKREARSRSRLRGRMVFSFEGRTYAAKFTSLDRIIVEDRITGRFIASTGFFVL